MSRPRRSSLKCLPESILCENSVLEKTFPRRVSFANVISVCGTTEGITQLPLSKCSEESNESTKRATLTTSMFTDATAHDVSMTICSDTSIQESPPCKPTVTGAQHVLSSSNVNRLSNILDVSMSDASALGQSESPDSLHALQQPSVSHEVQHCGDLESSSMQTCTETINVSGSSMVIDDTHPPKHDFVSISYDKSACATPKATVPATDRSALGVTNQSTQVSPCIEPIDTPSRARTNPATAQTPTLSTIQITPARQTISATSGAHSLVFTIPPLKSDPCLWNSAPGSQRRLRRRRLVSQSASRWDDRNKRPLYAPDQLDEHQRHVTDVDSARAAHSLSLNNTPIRRIKPMLDWSEAVKECKYNIPVAALQTDLYESRDFKAELARLNQDLITKSRLIPAEVAMESGTTTLSALLDLKNLPLAVDSIDLGDLCGPPPAVTELDGVLEKQSGSHTRDVDSSQTWWAKASNLNSLADTLLNSNRLLLYGKLCLDRQKAVLDTCPSAKLTESVDVVLCYFTAVDTLHRCHSEAIQELKELTKERQKSRQSYLQTQVDFLRQVDNELTRECEQLQEELDALNSEIADWEDFEVEDKENLPAALEHPQQLVDQLAQIDLQLREAKATQAADRWLPLRQHQQALLPWSAVIGGTELFGPSGSLVPGGRRAPAGDMSESEELTNLLCPSRLQCLDYAQHKYQVVCLLGHVTFVFSCCLCPSLSVEQHSSSSSNTEGSIGAPLHAVEHLLIDTVLVQSPEAALSPTDCPAVEQLARFAVEFFNSQHKSAFRLRERLVGMFLVEATDYLEFVLLPYLVAACDLRSIYMKGHSVQFSVPGHVMPTSPCCSERRLVDNKSTTLSSVLSTAPFELTPEQMKSYPCLEQVTPPWPVMVSIQLNHPPTRSLVDVTFTFDRLEFHRIVPCSTSVDVLIGQIGSQQIQSILDKEEIKLGHLHRIVSLIETSISSTQSGV